MVNTDFKLARQMLEARVKDATSGRGSSDALLIDRVADPADMTRELADRDVAVQILDYESAMVRLLRSAIDRFQDGSYGLCLECEEAIAPKRLQAVPWAERCIRCQEAADFEYRLAA